MGYRIGDVARTLDISIDTLRYYERIGLLPPVTRTAGGTRLYSERDLSRLRFVQRAQKMGFSLDEVRQLLRMREDPAGARDEIRQLTRDKLDEVEARLADLTVLRDELHLLLNLCRENGGDACPIIDGLDADSRARRD